MSKLFKYFGTEIQQGKYIFREGEEADAMYLIHKGTVKISKSIGNLEKRIQILHEGEFVGEMAIINSRPRSADAMAIEDCELIRMDRESFDNTINKNKQFAISFITFLSERLRDTTDQLTEYYAKEHHLEVETEILREIVRESKQDKAGKWRLIGMDDFIEHYNKIHLIEHTDLLTVLQDLEASNKISIKKDGNAKKWIAVKTF